MANLGQLEHSSKLVVWGHLESYLLIIQCWKLGVLGHLQQPKLTQGQKLMVCGQFLTPWVTNCWKFTVHDKLSPSWIDQGQK